MNLEERMEQIWGGLSHQQAPSLCAYASKLAQWAEPLVSHAEQGRDLVEINQAKLQLIDKYMSFRDYVPRTHRYKVTTTGHLCIWHVFEDYYNRLRLHELSITPPLLFLPEPAPPPPPPPQTRQVGGLYIAEEDDD